MQEIENQTITDEQYARVLRARPKLNKIGKIKDAIKTVRSLGWDQYGFKEFMDKVVNSNDGLTIVRIGNTYYWSERAC